MKPDFSLEGKRALITGGAKGIGRSIAMTFANLGAISSLVDIDREELEETVRKIKDDGGRAHTFVADITDLEVIKHLVQKAVQEMGGIDILVNNAGVAHINPAEKITEEEWDKTMAVNLKALFFLSREVGKHMIENKYGKIINLASQAGVIALEGHVAYTASKAGVIGVTKVLALEWGKYNINVNAVAPTVIMTPLGEKVWAGEKGEKFKEKIPLKRFGQPEDVASLVAFLSSDAANMITGTAVMIDGGYTAQ